MADEAERLAGIVSYTRDKVRLHEQARSWREKAQAVEPPPISVTPAADRTPILDWFRRRA